MQKLIYTITTLVFLVLFSGCREDGFVDTITTSRPDIQNVTFAEAKVNGVVLDARMEPVEGALVQWGETSATTDKNGAFSLTGTVSSKHAVLKVIKEGYFDANKVLQTFTEETIITSVSLIERELSGVLDAQSGGIIETNQGGKIEFAGGFENLDGTTYEGDVEVYVFYLHPMRGDFEQMMPGNQMAINVENERQVLESYGMLNVELQDPVGNVLQISQPAIITSPVPDEMMDSAPSNIPLWHYDVEDGYWKEEGSAILDGSNYVGEVSHFTWWNCDVPNDFVFLEGCIAPIRGQEWDHWVCLTIISSGATGITGVTQQGSFAGFIPKGEVLLLEIINLCGEVVYSEEIGPFEEDVVLPNIFIDTQGLEWKSLSGTLVDCNSDPVPNGYVSIHYSGLSKLIFVEDDGHFSVIVPDCVSNVLIYSAVDLENLKSSIPAEAFFDEDLDLGQIRVCEDLGGEFRMNLGGTEIVGQPAFVNVMQESDIDFYLYDVKFIHAQENGTVIYTLFVSISEQNGWQNWLAVSFQEQMTIVDGNPEYIFEYEINAPGDTQIEDNSGVPGSEFHFVTDVNVTNTVDNNVWQNVELRIRAIIQ